MINDDMIRHAKSLELPDLMRRRNIDLIPTNNGSSFKCLCPFHADKEPSFSLSFKEGLWQWYCFACGIGGTNIDFLMKFENQDFKTAVQSVCRDIDLKPGRMPDIHIKVVEPKCSLPERIRLLSLAVEHFQKILNSPAGGKGKVYLESRGLLDEELIKAFKIGFSDGNAKNDLKEHRFELRNQIGLFSISYHETFANCVIFPVLDEQGNPTDIYGRRIINYSNRNNHCYNTGKHTGIFNIANVIKAEEVILTEGIIDALSIYKAGFKNVTALYGINGLTLALDELLSSKKKIIFAFDNDEAGINGVKKYLAMLKNVEVLMIDLPKIVKDANELFVKEGAEALKQAIDKAFKPSMDFIEARTRTLKLTSVSEEAAKAILKHKLLDEGKEDDFPAKSGVEEAKKPEAFVAHATTNPGQGQNEESPSLTDAFIPKFTWNGTDIIFQSFVLTYEIRIIGKLKNLDAIRCLITACKDNEHYRDKIDLYLSRSRKIFENELVKIFNIQTAVIEKDLSAIILFIENDFKRKQEEKKKDGKEAYKMTDSEIAEALKFLKSKDLIKKIIDDISVLGYVGEDMNKLLLYLGATSRLLDKPLSILIRSISSSGKSFLIKLICDLMPPEDVHKWTAATKQALYYMAPDALKHKFIAIDEKHGIEEAEYPIRSLQSEGLLSLAVPVKNPSNGQITTEQVVKEGPIAYVDGSTDTRVNPENANRCFEIFLDDSKEQTKKIQEEQKKSHSLEGLQNADHKAEIKRIHMNAQRLLKPLKVIIPFVELIDFPTNWIRTRRDHDRFLNLIVCIAFLQQYQREQKELNGKPYIEATEKDYAIAYKIAKTVLFNTFQELEKPVFDFFLQLNEMVEQNSKAQGIKPAEYWFTRRTIRAFITLPDYLVKRFMRILTDLEYFDVRVGVQGSRFQYRLTRAINKRQEIEGLTTPAQLRAKLMMKNSPENTASANE